MNMRLGVAIFIALSIAFSGCAKKVKDVEPPELKQARQYMRDATVRLKQGEAVKAFELFGKAIQVAPDYFEAYYMTAETFLRLKQYEQSSAVMNTAVRRFPENAVAYYILALAQEGMGQMVPSIISARKSVELFAKHKDAAGERRSSLLLVSLVEKAKTVMDAQSVANAAQDAQAAQVQAAQAVSVPVLEGQ